MWFNRRRQRSGHLFEGRFGASLVTEDEYILKLSRYVHLNPVFVSAYADKTKRERLLRLRSYVWSSYPSYAGLSEPLDYVGDDPVLAMMDRRKKKQRLIYRRFVESGIGDIDAAFIAAKERSPYCIGSETYLEEVAAEQKKQAQGYSQREDLDFQKTEVLYSAEEVLHRVAGALGVETDELCRRQRNSWLRPLCSRALQLFSGLTHREIARTLSIGSGAAVSKQLRLLKDALAEDRHLQDYWQAIKRGVEQL